MLKTVYNPLESVWFPLAVKKSLVWTLTDAPETGVPPGPVTFPVTFAVLASLVPPVENEATNEALKFFPLVSLRVVNTVYA